MPAYISAAAPVGSVLYRTEYSTINSAVVTLVQILSISAYLVCQYIYVS